MACAMCQRAHTRGQGEKDSKEGQVSPGNNRDLG